MVLSGAINIVHETAPPFGADTMIYLGRNRDQISLHATGQPARLMLIGGEPLGEDVLIWWNFVFRDPEEALQARRDWAEKTGRFVPVVGYEGGRIPAPPEVTLTV